MGSDISTGSENSHSFQGHSRSVGTETATFGITINPYLDRDIEYQNIMKEAKSNNFITLLSQNIFKYPLQQTRTQTQTLRHFDIRGSASGIRSVAANCPHCTAEILMS